MKLRNLENMYKRNGKNLFTVFSYKRNGKKLFTVFRYKRNGKKLLQSLATKEMVRNS
jgi:hypothetical protein